MSNIVTISRRNPHYPPLLKEIKNPPEQLFARGNLHLLKRCAVSPAVEASPTLAVVGSRKMSAYGRQCSEYILPSLIRAGVVIVSGLALGIDGFAHEITLREGGMAIAVLGGGVDADSIAPRSNFALAERIISGGGVIISEYPPGETAYAAHFPERNRIIAGLARAVLVMEAASNSGSLITAILGLENNREVLAVPGPIFSNTAIGVNRILKYGAQVVTSAADVAATLGLALGEKKSPPKPQTPEEEKILAALVSLTAVNQMSAEFDEIAAACALPTAAVMSTLTLLELRGAVRNCGGMRYAIA